MSNVMLDDRKRTCNVWHDMIEVEKKMHANDNMLDDVKYIDKKM